MEAVRQRTPFRYSDDEDEPARILDEQEQEEVIEDIRKQSERSGAIYHTALQIIITLSACIHIRYLFDSTGQSPYAVLLKDPSPPNPIPFAPFFTLYQLFIHLNLFLLVSSPHHILRRIIPTDLPVPFPYPLTHVRSVCMSFFAPLEVLILRATWSNFIWWSTVAALHYLVYTVECWNTERENEIQGLEKLKYDARGV